MWTWDLVSMKQQCHLSPVTTAAYHINRIKKKKWVVRSIKKRKAQTETFWVVTLRSVAGCYQYFGDKMWFHLQSYDDWYSIFFWSICTSYKITRCHNEEGHILTIHQSKSVFRGLQILHHMRYCENKPLPARCQNYFNEPLNQRAEKGACDRLTRR